MRRHLPLKSPLPRLISWPHSHSPGHIRQPRVWVIMLKVTRTWRRRWRLLFCFYISEPGSRRGSNFYATTGEVSNPAPPTVKFFALKKKRFIFNIQRIFRVQSLDRAFRVPEFQGRLLEIVFNYNYILLLFLSVSTPACSTICSCQWDRRPKRQGLDTCEWVCKRVGGCQWLS